MVAAEATASSEEVRSERGGGGDLGDPKKKKASAAALRGVRRCVAQRGGRGRSGGASGRVGEARGEAVAAVGASGGDGCVRVDAREGDRGGDELEGEVEASRGCRGAV